MRKLQTKPADSVAISEELRTLNEILTILSDYAKSDEHPTDTLSRLIEELEFRKSCAVIPMD